MQTTTSKEALLDLERRRQRLGLRFPYQLEWWLGNIRLYDDVLDWLDDHVGKNRYEWYIGSYEEGTRELDDVKIKMYFLSEEDKAKFILRWI